jgi:hypothetical protein
LVKTEYLTDGLIDEIPEYIAKLELKKTSAKQNLVNKVFNAKY